MMEFKTEENKNYYFNGLITGGIIVFLILLTIDIAAWALEQVGYLVEGNTLYYLPLLILFLLGLIGLIKPFIKLGVFITTKIQKGLEAKE